MLEVQRLSWAVGGRDLLSDVSFRQNGGVLALLGPSGSGKTTVFRLLCGLETPTAGSITWKGEKLSEKERLIRLPERRPFGFVFQEPVIFSHLSVVENVGFGLLHLPRDTRLEKAREWLSRFDIQNLEEKSTAFLSGGEKQRVALARALAREPELLLLDEPFSAVDRLTRAALLSTLNEILRSSARFAIIATHDARDAADLKADHVVLLREGRLAACGAWNENFAADDAWARGFLNSGLGIGGTT